MEMSGQLQAPAVLLPGKEPPVPIGWETGCSPEPVWTNEFRTDVKYKATCGSHKRHMLSKLYPQCPSAPNLILFSDNGFHRQ
jgi:hypothetical protein